MKSGVYSKEFDLLLDNLAKTWEDLPIKKIFTFDSKDVVDNNTIDQIMAKEFYGILSFDSHGYDYTPIGGKDFRTYRIKYCVLGEKINCRSYITKNLGSYIKDMLLPPDLLNEVIIYLKKLKGEYIINNLNTDGYELVFYLNQPCPWVYIYDNENQVVYQFSPRDIRKEEQHRWSFDKANDIMKEKSFPLFTDYDKDSNCFYTLSKVTNVKSI